MSTADRYVFDTGDPNERRRLAAHAELWDPFTFRQLAATGMGTGWRCLEIGAGTGTVAGWLADRVGPRGLVVATDIETRWLEPLAADHVIVHRHDIVAEPLDPVTGHDPATGQSAATGDGYDLVHARLVLEHLPERAAVVDKLTAALRPGGWLVVEDYDIRTMGLTEPPLPAWTAVTGAVVEVMRAGGSDPLCGSELAALLRSAGLADVTSEGYVRPSTIAELTPVFRPALEALREPLLRRGAVTAGQLAEALGAYDGPASSTRTYTPILVAASGRRPERPDRPRSPRSPSSPTT